MNKRAIFVIGPESSGTKNMARLISAAGFVLSDEVLYENDVVQWQKMTDYEKIVIRFSIPFNKQWPPLGEGINIMKRSGYDVSCVVTTRDWNCMSLSQVQNEHVQTIEKSKENIGKAYAYIFSNILIDDNFIQSRCKHMTVSYESLIYKPNETLNFIEQEMNIKFPLEISKTIKNGNQKYYK